MTGLSNLMRAVAFGILFFTIFQSAIISAYAQGLTCEAALSRASIKQLDGLFPVYRLNETSAPIIGIPKSPPQETYLLSSYVQSGVSPFIGDFVQPSIIRFEHDKTKVRIFETFGNLTYADGSPLARTQDTSFSDSRFLELSKIQCTDEAYSYVTLSSTALKVLGFPALQQMSPAIGMIRPAAISSTMSTIATYKDNINFTVDAQIFSSRFVRGAANNSVIAARISHSIMRLPNDSFRTRAPDPSVGFFTVNTINLTKLATNSTSAFIQRWRLEKQNPGASLSAPVKPIVFWIENTTPYAFRDPIRDGVLAWNEAFEAAGFTNAIEVKIQPDDADWDAGDINYNVIRWEASPHNSSRIGYGPSISDPRTGEILAADILLNFTGIANRYGNWLTIANYNWIDQQAPGDDITFDTGTQDNITTAFIQGTPFALADADTYYQGNADRSVDGAYRDKIQALGPTQKPVQRDLKEMVKLGQVIAASSKGVHSNPETTIKSRQKIRTPLSGKQSPVPSHNAALSVDTTAQADSAQPLTERMIREIVTNLTMHEVGHTLGLTHNFSGSRYRSHVDIHNQQITKGVISGSVMDYTPVNFAPPGVEQGDFANSRLGPYDIWAVRFGYDPDLDQDKSGRAALLRQAIEPGYQYGNRFDDPHSLTFDLTSDPTAYSKDSLHLVRHLIGNADDWSTREDTKTNLSIFRQLLDIRTQSLSTIVAQLSAFQLEVDESFERSDRNRIITTFTTKQEQMAALQTLKEVLFASEDWTVPETLNRRLGVYASSPATRDGGRLALADYVLSELINPSFMYQLLLAQDQGTDGLNAEEFFSQLRAIVFAQELGPTGNPSQTRRAQHYFYVNKLTKLLDDTMARRNQLGPYDVSQLALRRVLEKEIELIKRELRMPYLWASEETKLHRKELREMLPR